MADNTNKVTIDVAWFDELRSTANGEKYKMIEAAYNQVRKELDELREKLDAVTRTNNLIINTCENSCAAANRLAAAERCIEEIESVMSVSVISDCAEGEKVNGIIRAYREAKEAK